LEGDVPSPADPPPGCHFNTRCSYALNQCRTDPSPKLKEVELGHWVRCWRAREIRKL
jgi:oligopeptide/dipeptide ABC transporter ATP-binding protein